MTPVDEVIGRGIHLTLVGFHGADRSFLRDEIEEMARKEKIEGEIKFVDIEDKTQMIFIRTEIGRKLISLKIIEPSYEAYAKKGDKKYQSHTNPLWGLLPTLLNKNDPEQAYQSFIYALLTESILEDENGDFVQHLLDGERIALGSISNEHDINRWANNYRAKVDASSRYIHLIRKEGFKSVNSILHDAKSEYGNQPWGYVLNHMIEELKLLAKFYHQEI